MSRLAVLDALLLAVKDDTQLKVVEDADVPIVAQKLPCASVVFDGDETVEPGEFQDSRIYRFWVRVYVRLGKDLRTAERELLARADALDFNLGVHRRLTEAAEYIGRTNGDVGKSAEGAGGPDYLVYDTTVRVEQRSPYDVTLSASGMTVTLRDVTYQTYPLQPPSLEFLPDPDNNLVAYVSKDTAETCRVSGRVQTTKEAEALALWTAANTELTMSDLRGNVTTGWHIAGSPDPSVRRLNLTSETFDCDLTLWRV